MANVLNSEFAARVALQDPKWDWAMARAKLIVERCTRDGYCPEAGTDPWEERIAVALHEALCGPTLK